MKLNLKNKFLIPTISVCILCLAAISFISYSKSSTALEKSISDQARQASASISKQIASWLAERKNSLKNFSEETVFKNAFDPDNAYNSQEAVNRLKKIKAQNRFFELIALARPDGGIIASSTPEYIGVMNIADRQYFRTALAGDTDISGVVKSKGSGRPVFCISMPVTKDRAVVGVMFGVVDLGKFTGEFVDSERIGTNGYAYIANQAGLILSYPDKSKILSLDLSQYDFGRQMLSQGTGLIQYQFKGIDKIVAFSREQNLGWIVAATANTDELFAPIVSIRNMNLVIGSISVLVIGSLLFLITRSVVTPINTIIAGMEEGAVQVASASEQVSAASQTLAQGASQQASAIEETSASMEEIASMTRQNTESAAGANQLMKETQKVVDTANLSMTELTRSMEDISAASQETAQIIKTIDEIAFQTNLLALNAAVEAARAGDAGAGFAVVADEVRNLAMRAADAAKNTSGLIGGTLEKVEEGAKLVSATNEAFEEVSRNTTAVGTLVEEIALASDEQGQGIEQVTQAIAEMDSVVQQNAANAEESAGASEEMNAQAEQLNGYVEDLVALVTGGGNGMNGNSTRTLGMKRSAAPRLAGPPRKRTVPEKRLKSSGAAEVQPEQLICMDDDPGFKDF